MHPRNPFGNRIMAKVYVSPPGDASHCSFLERIHADSIAFYMMMVAEYQEDQIDTDERLMFDRYLGMDWSGGRTPTASLRGLPIYMVSRKRPPGAAQPPRWRGGLRESA